MPSNINPNLEPTKDLSRFKFWCQKVLPAVYDDSISYYEVLCKVVNYLNDVIDDVNADMDNVETLYEAFMALQLFVNETSGFVDRAERAAESAERDAGTCVEKAEIASTSASNANRDSLKAEGYSVGKQNGVDVGSTSPYYHNNAKYYADYVGEPITELGSEYKGFAWVNSQKVASADGVIIPDAQYSTVTLKVSPGGKIKGFTRALNQYAGIVFFDYTGKYISGFYNNNGTNDWEYELTVPEKADYVIISCLTATNNLFNCFFTEVASAVLDINDRVEKMDKVFYCGSTRTLNTLKAGIEKATSVMNATLYVDAGIYDLVSEFGSNYFDNLTSLNQFAGLTLKNNVHVIFSPYSKVVSNYQGSNQYALSLYSPFNAGEYGFTIENLNLECSRCRYGIHDERNGSSENYKSVIKNCKIKYDNSQPNPSWAYGAPIAGGFASKADVTIENCIFELVVPSSVVGYYHQSNNNLDSNHAFRFTFKNNYTIGGSFRLQATREDSNIDSILIACDNSFDGADFGTYLITGTHVISKIWNNQVRT